MVILYHVFFGLGFSTVPWVYSAEVNSLGWRTRGAAAATSVNWLGGFVVVQITKVGLDHLKWRFFLSKSPFLFFFLFFYRKVLRKLAQEAGDFLYASLMRCISNADAYIVFAIFSFMITPMIYLFYPETANRTLEDMDQIFIHNPSALVCGNRAATQSRRPQLYIDAETVRIAQAGNDSREAVSTDNEKKASPHGSALEV